MIEGIELGPVEIEHTVRISCSLRGAVPEGLHMTEQKNRFHASVF